MSHPAGDASLTWALEPAVVLPAGAAAALYVRGWLVLSRRMPDRFGRAQAGAFLGGLATLILALCSPLDGLGRQFLQAHMIQHLLLMLVAPPLLWLGAPVAPLLLGLPRPVRRQVAIALGTLPMRRPARALPDPR